MATGYTLQQPLKISHKACVFHSILCKLAPNCLKQ